MRLFFLIPLVLLFVLGAPVFGGLPEPRRAPSPADEITPIVNSTGSDTCAGDYTETTQYFIWYGSARLKPTSPAIRYVDRFEKVVVRKYDASGSGAQINEHVAFTRGPKGEAFLKTYRFTDTKRCVPQVSGPMAYYDENIGRSYGQLDQTKPFSMESRNRREYASDHRQLYEEFEFTNRAYQIAKEILVLRDLNANLAQKKYSEIVELVSEWVLDVDVLNDRKVMGARKWFKITSPFTRNVYPPVTLTYQSENGVIDFYKDSTGRTHSKWLDVGGGSYSSIWGYDGGIRPYSIDMVWRMKQDLTDVVSPDPTKTQAKYLEYRPTVDASSYTFRNKLYDGSWGPGTGGYAIPNQCEKYNEIVDAIRADMILDQLPSYLPHPPAVRFQPRRCEELLQR